MTKTLLVVLLAGCGGSESSVSPADTTPGDVSIVGDASTTDSTKGDFASADDSGTPCPTKAPTEASACSLEGLTCPYDATCSDGMTAYRKLSFECVGGSWTDLLGPGSACLGPTDAGTVDAGCPAVEPARAGSCAGLRGKSCVYPPGGKCHTYSCTGIGWLGPGPTCTPGCPKEAPKAGAPCTPIDVVCFGYDDPRPDCGTHAICTGSGWKVEVTSTCSPLPP